MAWKELIEEYKKKSDRDSRDRITQGLNSAQHDGTDLPTKENLYAIYHHADEIKDNGVLRSIKGYINASLGDTHANEGGKQIAIEFLSYIENERVKSKSNSNKKYLFNNQFVLDLLGEFVGKNNYASIFECIKERVLDENEVRGSYDYRLLSNFWKKLNDRKLKNLVHISDAKNLFKSLYEDEIDDKLFKISKMIGHFEICRINSKIVRGLKKFDREEKKKQRQG